MNKARPDAQGVAESAGDSARNLKDPSSASGGKSLLADIALRGGASLVRQGIERGLLGGKSAPVKAAKMLKGRRRGGSLLHGAILRLATRSVPGAILVGGGLLAKALHDRRKARRAREQAAAPAQDREDDGEEA